MAVLPDADRTRIWRGLMRIGERYADPIDKAALRAAVDATDDWIDANAASFNAALPVTARDNLTAAQKTLLFCAMAAFRVSQAFAQRLLGGMD